MRKNEMLTGGKIVKQHTAFLDRYKLKKRKKEILLKKLLILKRKGIKKDLDCIF